VVVGHWLPAGLRRAGRPFGTAKAPISAIGSWRMAWTRMT